MFFYRMKPSEAMDHLGIVSRETFGLWCEKVQIQFHPYEFSNRKYLISGEFYAKADEIEIKKIKAIHGDNWMNYYKHAEEVLAFLSNETPIENRHGSTYKPKSKDIQAFIKKLKK